MKVSVIVPVWNVEEYIEKCLESLVNQTLKDIEIILVNDGSPDNSQKIIDKYVKNYPKKVKSYIKENGGQGSARNYGLKVAKGEYIAFIDSDDYIDLDMLEKMYNKGNFNNSDIVICGNKVVDINYKLIRNELAIKYDNELDLLIGKMGVCNKIYKKEILKKLEFRTKMWYEDIDYTAKLILDNNKFSFVDECLYNYLLRPGSTMNNSNIHRNLELIQAFEEIIKYFKTQKKYDDVKEKIEFLCIDHMYISGIVRIINADADKKEKKEIINKFKNYMKSNFPAFNNNIYLKYLSKNRKIIYILIKFNMYIFIKLIFKIRNK